MPLEVSFDQSTIRELLDRYNFIYDEVVPRWGAREWILKTTRGLTRNKRIEGMSIPCVCLRRDIYEQLITNERPDMEKTVVMDTPLDIIEQSVTYGSSSWSAQAQGD